MLIVGHIVLERQGIDLKIIKNKANALVSFTVGHHIYVVWALDMALPHITTCCQQVAKHMAWNVNSILHEEKTEQNTRIPLLEEAHYVHCVTWVQSGAELNFVPWDSSPRRSDTCRRANVYFLIQTYAIYFPSSQQTLQSSTPQPEDRHLQASCLWVGIWPGWCLSHRHIVT